MNIIYRRGILAAWACVAAWGLGNHVYAQDSSYPSRAVRIVVPVSAGSVIDVIAREYGEQLQGTLGQAVVVENRPGANQSIGISNVISSPADGYTLLLTTTELVRAPLTFPNINYDPFEAFIPLAHIASTSGFFVVPASSPARTLQEFIDLSKRAPKPLSYGTVGYGSGGHFYGEMIAVQTGAKLLDIPYKGEVPLLPDLLGGRLDAGWLSALAAVRHAQEGQLRILAVSSLRQRASILPDVPTFAELGIQGIDIEGFIGYFVVKGTPPAIIQRLSDELNRIAATPRMRQRMVELGFEPRSGGTMASFQATMQGVHDGWSKANKLVNIKIE